MRMSSRVLHYSRSEARWKTKLVSVMRNLDVLRRKGLKDIYHIDTLRIKSFSSEIKSHFHNELTPLRLF